MTLVPAKYPLYNFVCTHECDKIRVNLNYNILLLYQIYRYYLLLILINRSSFYFSILYK